MNDKQTTDKHDTTRITFVGAGNMARSLINGLIRSGHDPADICASDPSPGQRKLIKALGVTTYAANAPAVAGADVIVAAVKPQVLRAVLTSLTNRTETQLLISAGS